MWKKNKIKTLWEKNLCDFGFYNEFLDITPKAWSTDRKKKKSWVEVKLKTTPMWKILLREHKQASHWEKISPKTYMLKKFYPKYTRKLYIATIGKQPN